MLPIDSNFYTAKERYMVVVLVDNDNSIVKLRKKKANSFLH